MNIILRPWTINDLDRLITIGDDADIAKNMTNGYPYPFTREKGEFFIAMGNKSDPPTRLAIQVDGVPAGSIGIHRQEDIQSMNAELGYFLGSEYRGKGIMNKVLVQMVEYGFWHWDINRIFARPFGSNIASQKALEKAGFVLEARFEKTYYKNGLFEDELVYAVRR